MPDVTGQPVGGYLGRLSMISRKSAAASSGDRTDDSASRLSRAIACAAISRAASASAIFDSVIVSSVMVGGGYFVASAASISASDISAPSQYS